MQVQTPNRKKTFELSAQIASSDTRSAIYEFLETKVNAYNKKKDNYGNRTLVLPKATESTASFWSCHENDTQKRTMGIKIILKDPTTGAACANWGFVYSASQNGWKPTSATLPSVCDNNLVIDGDDSKYLLKMMLNHCGNSEKSKNLKATLEELVK
jgi:hypothetical protein